MRIDLWTDDLFWPQLTYQSVLEAIHATPFETSRIEHKQKVTDDTVVETAAAFANSEGGIIAIGFEDRRDQSDGQLTMMPLEVSEKVETQVVNRILSLTYPSVNCTCRRFENPTTPGSGFLVVQIPESLIAPHELARGHRFLRRYDKQNSPMPLSELEALQRRRDTGGVPSNPHGVSETPQLLYGAQHFDQIGNHIAIVVTPYSIRPPRELDDREYSRLESLVGSTYQAELDTVPVIDGAVFGKQAPPGPGPVVALKEDALHIRADGQIVRRRIHHGMVPPYSELIYELFKIQALTSRLYSRWRLGPRMRIWVQFSFPENRQLMSGENPAPTFDTYETRFDLAAKPPWSNVRPYIIRWWQAARLRERIDQNEEALEDTWHYMFSNYQTADDWRY